MPLILAPSFDEHTRAEIEQHILQVQSRRMVAAIEYQRGENAKLEHLAQKIRDKVQKQYTMLGKEIAALDKADEKVQHRMETIISLMSELGLVQDMILTEEQAKEEA